MSIRILLAAIIVGCSGVLAGADAISAYGSQEPGPSMPIEGPGVGAYLTYGPDGIVPGVPTLVTVYLTDVTGTGFGVDSIDLSFAPPSGLGIDNFSWESGLGSSPYFAVETLFSPYTFLLSGSPVMVPSWSGDPVSLPIFSFEVAIGAITSAGEAYTLPGGVVIRNEAGAVVASEFVSASGEPLSGMVFTAVPEPASVCLLLAGGLAALRRTRRQPA